jgi:hypothetical protein
VPAIYVSMLRTEIDPKKIIAEVSGHDIDQWVRTAAFKPEVEEVGKEILLREQSAPNLRKKSQVVSSW